MAAADPRLDAAIAALRRAAAADPRAVVPRYNLALLLLRRGDRTEARKLLHAVLRLAPNFAPALFTQGRLALDARELVLAETLLRRALHAPGLTADVGVALAETLRRGGRIGEATALLRDLVAAAPREPDAYVNLAQLRLGEAPGESLDVAERGLAALPRAAILHALRGQSLLRLKRPDEAVDALKIASEIDPTLAPAAGHLLRACREAARWNDETEALAAVRGLLARDDGERHIAIPLQSALNFPFTGEEIKRIAMAEAAFRGRDAPPLPPMPPTAPERPLVVGYLSPDFRDHAIAHLVADLFAAHDPARVRAVAFSEGPDDGDPVRGEIARTADRFVDLRGLSDRDAALRIRAEGTHILVDLALYTRHHRPGIPAHRPAPIQVAWLGLPATTGAPWFDYLLADDIVAPPEHDDRFTETLIRLPCGYQPNRRLLPLPPPPERAACGLPEGTTILACFNAHLKIDRESFAAWIEILNGVPGSMLWLLEPPAAVAERYRAVAADRGIAPERLIFAPKQPRALHLARLAHADLMLDCLTYGAHTTCSDSLRAGVPMLTVLGENFAARVGASILARAGLPELVLPDRAAFVAEAIRLGNDPSARAALRQKLAVCVPASPVFDPAAQAHALEDAFETMWANRRA